MKKSDHANDGNTLSTIRIAPTFYLIVLAASCSHCNSQGLPFQTAKFNRLCPRNTSMHSSITPTLPAAETPAPGNKELAVAL